MKRHVDADELLDLIAFLRASPPAASTPEADTVRVALLTALESWVLAVLKRDDRMAA